MSITPLAPPAVVAAPPRTAHSYGLFSHLTFGVTGVRWDNGVEVAFDTCPSATAFAIGCDTDLPESPLGGVDVEPFNPFSVVAEYSCFTSVQEVEAGAQRQLTVGEQYAVEQYLYQQVAGDDGTIPDSGITFQSWPQTIGAMEQSFADATHGMQGVVHMDRQAATAAIASDAVVRTGNGLTTALGTPVVAGGGYPPDTVWMTGPILGFRGDIDVIPAEDLFDQSTNTLTAIAQRTYVIGVDPCGLIATTVA